MFENLVAGSIEPEIVKILHSLDAALDAVVERLQEQLHGNDLVAALSAGVQLKALAAWKPAIADVIASLDKPKPAAPHTPVGHGH